MDPLTDKCKSILITLLHFKHMLLFVYDHLHNESQQEIVSLFPGFKDKISSQLSVFNDLIYNHDGQDAILKFITETELKNSNIQEERIETKKMCFKITTEKKAKHTKASKRKLNLIRQNDTAKISPVVNKVNNVIVKSKSNKINDIETIVCDVDLVKEDSYNPNNITSCSSDSYSDKSDETLYVISELDDINQSVNSKESNVYGIPISYSCQYEKCKFRNVSLSEVKAHELRNHANKTYKCPQNGCDSRLSSCVDLSYHLINVHQVFQCIINRCNAIFTNQCVLFVCL